MDAVELISILSSIASLILAIMAITLSIIFFRMSSRLSESTKEAAKGIGSSVERLEKLFDKLYSDTFSMMRDTVSDMRKHIWPDETTEPDRLADEVEKKTDEKMRELRKTISHDLATVLQQQRITDEKLKTVRAEISHLIDKAIRGSRQVELEAREETLRTVIIRSLRILRRRRRQVAAQEIVERLGKVPIPMVIEELEKLRKEGLIDTSDEEIRPDTIITINRLFSAVTAVPESESEEPE